MEESNKQTRVNEWSQLSFDELEEMERQNEAGLTDEQKERIARAKESITGLISEIRPDTILDVGTGRGSLVTSLIEGLEYKPKIVCLDRSKHILEYLRKKLDRNLRSDGIDFVSGDIAELPFETGSFEVVTSFGSIGNMNPDKAPEGLNEIYRVLKKGGLFIDFTTVFKGDSESVKRIRELWSRQNAECKKLYAVFQDIVELYQSSPFGDVDFEFTKEGIETNPNPNDLVPVKGDRFSDLIIKATK